MEKNDFSVDELKKAIENQIRYSYLDKFIDQPEIDEDKLIFLAEIFYGTSYSLYQQKSFIVTTMLVQIALDTHDKVSVDNSADESDNQKKKQQLTVLAGDYYSGLYYFLLSKMEDIQMIKMLASAIKEVNEAKMTVYYRESSSVDEFILGVQHIESLLIRRAAEYVKKEAISDYAAAFLLKKKLLKEKKILTDNGTSSLIQLMTEGTALSLTYKEAVKAVEVSLKKLTKKAEKHYAELPDHFLKLRESREKLKMNSVVHVNSKALEEG